MSLEGKVALVTGGSHGIGKATALALARDGADVAITFRNREDGAQDTVRQIEAIGRNALLMHAEMTDLENCSKLVDRSVERFGRLDILVNNAGGGRKDSFTHLSFEDWKYTLDLCVTAPFLLGQAAANQMIQQGEGGAIISISSVHSTHVWPNDTPYGVAKAALNRLTGSMALELAKFGIRANAIAPGYINTSENAEEQQRYDDRDGQSAELQTMKRTGVPAEIAETAAFLASDRASFINGQTIFVDGGLLLPRVTTADFIRGDREGRGHSG